MLNFLESVYKSSPNFLQKLFSEIPLEIRMGRSFRETRRMLRNTRNMNREDLQALQERELENVLNHAVRTVPAYSDIEFKKETPALEKLSEFPVITKEEIQARPDQFISTEVPTHQTYQVSTGGTSGNQLEFVLDNQTWGTEWAFIMDLWERVGYKPMDPVVSLRGGQFQGSEDLPPSNHDPMFNVLELSPFHLTDENIAHYLDVLREFEPKFIWGYPSAITVVAGYVEREGIDNLPPIRATLAASENVYPEQRRLIERALDTRFFSWYGQSEKVILAGECECSEKYHAYPQYGVTELIGEDGREIHDPGVRGELVGTGFMNRALPFIRYRTGDSAQIVAEGCGCGREFQLLEEVRGRWTQEFLVGKEGELISMTALNMHSGVFSKVQKYRFKQDVPGRARIELVPLATFDDSDAENVIDELDMKVGNSIEFEIDIVDTLPRTSRGKHKFIEQILDLEEFGWRAP